MKNCSSPQAGPPLPGPCWGGCGGLSPARFPPERPGPVLLAAPEKAQTRLGRKHKSELGTKPHCAGALPGQHRHGPGPGQGCGIAASPAPSCPFSCGLSPPVPSPGPPGTAAAPAERSHPPGPGLGSPPAFSSAAAGRKGEPGAASVPCGDSAGSHGQHGLVATGQLGQPHLGVSELFNPAQYMAQFGGRIKQIKAGLASLTSPVCPQGGWVTQAGDAFGAALPGGNRGGLLSPASQHTPKVSVPQSKPCLVLEHPDCALTKSIQAGMTLWAHPAAVTGELELLARGVELLCPSLRLSFGCEIINGP